MLRSFAVLVFSVLTPFALLAADVPNVKFTALPGESLNEHKIRFQDLKGKVVLVDFWATWCEPCKEALPHYAALYKKYKQQGLVVIAINEDEKAVERDAYLKKTPYPFPVFADPEKKLLATFDVAAIPTVFVFDKNTKPVTFIRGFDAKKAQVLEKTVQDLLNVR
ncbi:TlpA family protein disulfide reductase [Bdellovibrio sp. SKB1291214]|uniref:TlpA disulfide reductase family protein n=1 Tax=Bdellovibrio sp. SKB1291214 TaxID=1732569 RepID=UPI000B51DAA4|nr:TlpA disulfide reductase family protein [Bdellovibrio sp. SKB1291214]UYL08329.1 TlpA family protein disulfide reductase [Bdellovibrio sp. SKB1291214]